ncbi:LacI family DNA-binding transcriptional regulator [Microbacterium aurantiacum]|uniref:LacI family DNA-binding transcriptional regulator n=1 Tax=Microbacterium aurantiacum TaxID=162393 RepID=UPI000C7F87BE|nr:LacI family DNA-binding transcriptional regulator [Microbacterium aurantiacum]
MSTSARGSHTPSVTMRDVAEVAGVSVATVSHVVNDKPGARIGEDARRRVQEAVASLGYRPNALAKTLSQGTSRFIGLVADQIATTPFAGQIIHGAQDEAWKHGYVLLVANTDGNDEAEAEAIAMMLEHQVHGVLYSTWYHREVVVPEALHATDTVLVGCFAAEGGLPAVVPDEEQGGRTATEELLAAGHRRIAFINTTTPSPAQTGRLAGYRSALEGAGVEFDDALVFPASPEQGGGYATTPRIVASGATAVFCHNDRVAMGLYDGLREQGLRIPEDVAVIGFDNQDVIAAHLRPPLSTVALPHYELGAAGVRILLGIDADTGSEPRLIVCPPILRQSV